MNATTKTETAITPVEMVTNAEAQLPAVVTQKFSSKGDLISRKNFTADQIEAIAQAAAAFDIRDSAAVLNFGADTQRRAAGYMSEIIGGMRIEEAGVAGEILTEISTGIDMMNVDKVRDQLKNPYSWFGRLMVSIGLWSDYLKAFITSYKTVLELYKQVERRSNNLIQDLSAESRKMDQQVVISTDQIGEMGFLIAVGEDILEAAMAEFAEERAKVLSESPVDSLKLQTLVDFKDSIQSFEVRLLRIQTAYVRLSTSAIPAIRKVQNSVKIEIQNIHEGILYDMNDFLELIIFFGTLKKTQTAQAARREYDEKLRKMRDVAGDVIGDVHEAAVASQGLALKRAEDIRRFNDKMLSSARKVLEVERRTAAERAEAYEILLQTRDDWVEETSALVEEAV